MVRAAGGKSLPTDVVEQIVAKTDGVPLFVEELTKMMLESGLLRLESNRYRLTGSLQPLAIPTTLQDSLTARLDRLASAKATAQLGAMLGREFPYAVLQSRLDGGRERPAARPRATRRRRVPVSTRHSTRNRLYLQARADPGCGLPIVAANHARPVPRTNRAGADRAVR